MYFKKNAKTILRACDLTEPVIFQAFQDNNTEESSPEFLGWGPDKFVEIFGDKLLPFRKGHNARTLEPQWDVLCSVEEMSIGDFIGTTKYEDDAVWRYFDYKYMSQWFRDKPHFLKYIDWKRFGFDKDGNDSTLWIGSKGAHTNCHQDSYGCNLVAQIHGRKLWLLFPPDTGNAIKPTRVPYEESTIYSKFNFFCPTAEDERSLLKVEKNARLVVLEPGDVLLVPNGWWHYVESLDFSISVNVWLPIDGDHKERIKEALVKLLVSRISQGLSIAPEPEYSHEEAIELISTCLDEYKKHIAALSSVSPAAKKLRADSWTARELAAEYPQSVKLLPELTRNKFHEWLSGNRQRFSEIENSRTASKDIQSASNRIINALCNYDIINKVSELLLQEE